MSMRKRVLVLIEDNPDDVDLTLRALKKNNIMNPVVVLNDGADALDYFHRRGAFADRDPDETPQVILLDLKLPRVSGLDVLKDIRANPSTSLLPVVILTSSREDRDIVNGYMLGANSYVRKPVDFLQFSNAVHQLGLYWLLLNEAPAGQDPT